MRVSGCSLALSMLLVPALPTEAMTFDEAFPGQLEMVSPEYQKPVSELDIRQGEVILPGGEAKLEVSESFFALDAEDARYVVETLWGNPPSPEVLGMIFPRDKSPVEDTWGIVITYDAMGYVSDADAASINYDDLLEQMRSEIEAENAERRKEGFPSMSLLGWAEPPKYDSKERKLYWAELIRFEGDTENTLNFKIRALGRKGVLQLNFVAAAADLAEVKVAAPAVLAMTSFVAGSRYSDFNPDLDTVAAVGIGGLIAGKAAAKAGLLAMALLFLKKGFVVILIAIGALWGRIRNFFSGTPVSRPPSAETEQERDHSEGSS